MEIPEGYRLIKESDYQELLNIIAELKERVKVLEGQINKDSHNSHLPPSKGIFKVIKNSRVKSGRKQGGQKGHPGKTLEMVSNPDKIEVYPVSHCEKCGLDISKMKADRFERRQVFDLPEIKMQTTEHRAETKICTCGHVNKSRFPARVNASVQYGINIQTLCISLGNYQFMSYDRISEFMEDLTGYRINESTINKQNILLYQELEIFETAVRKHLENSEVTHHDESGIYCQKKRIWLHSSSTKDCTHYGVDAERGKDAMDRIGILPKRNGKIVHDCWATYFLYTYCEHVLCNVHHIRELIWFEEEENAIWAIKLKTLLLDAKKQVELAKENGKKELETKTIVAIEKQFHAIIEAGIKGIPIPAQVKKRGKPKKPKQLNFLERFVKRKASVLDFMYDFNIPFDNNLAERDIRMIKVKQKVSGTFRSLEGANSFARIRSYISTVKKNKRNVMREIRNALLGKPFLITT